MIDKIKEMKKIELHLHLDGSLEIETAMELSGLTREEVREQMIARDKCLNLTEYLTKFDLPISIMQDRNNLIRVARDLVNYLESENVIYAEVRFAPVFHTKKGLSMEEVIDAVREGLNSNSKVKTNLILCMMRGMDKETNLSVIDVAFKYLGNGVCAIDLAGDDRYPLDDYAELFEVAMQKKIPFTIHAGETNSALEVGKAIELGATRIGHGIHAISDREVLDLIKKNNILLEVCPTSNVQTNVVSEYQKHPIYELYKFGIKVNVNTDNKTVSNVSISDEYEKLCENFDFTVDDFRRMNVDAVESAFLSNEEKERLLKELD